MRRIKIIFSLVFIFLAVQACSQDTAFIQVALYNGEVIIDVPSKWRLKENAMEYAVYEIAYDVKVSDQKGKSYVALYVYGEKYGPGMQVNDSIVSARKEGKLSDPNRKVQIIEEGLKNVGGLQIGFLKYTFLLDKTGKTAYGIDMFFTNSKNIYYKIEIVSYHKKSSISQNTAETIFKSFYFKS